MSSCCPTQAEETQTAYKGLTEFLKNTLGERVEKVSISNRLADSPCALVTSKFGWSAYQERIMKSQVSPHVSSHEKHAGPCKLPAEQQYGLGKTLLENCIWQLPCMRLWQAATLRGLNLTKCESPGDELFMDPAVE